MTTNTETAMLSRTLLCYVFLLSGLSDKDTHHRKPNESDRDYQVGQICTQKYDKEKCVKEMNFYCDKNKMRTKSMNAKQWSYGIGVCLARSPLCRSNTQGHCLDGIPSPTFTLLHNCFIVQSKYFKSITAKICATW